MGAEVPPFLQLRHLGGLAGFQNPIPSHGIFPRPPCAITDFRGHQASNSPPAASLSGPHSDLSTAHLRAQNCRVSARLGTSICIVLAPQQFQTRHPSQGQPELNHGLDWPSLSCHFAHSAPPQQHWSRHTLCPRLPVEPSSCGPMADGAVHCTEPSPRPHGPEVPSLRIPPG